MAEINSKEILDRFGKNAADMMGYVDELRHEIFNKESWKKWGRQEKIDNYELARKTLMEDLNFSFKIQQANKDFDRETLMLMSIIQSLPDNVRSLVATQIKNIIANKEKYLLEADKENKGDNV